jgi:CRISPR system Cascade subunit CasA
MTDTPSVSFNLVDRPWIAVRFVDGSTSEVSVRDVFRRAAEIREIAGELPTQDFAIIRLLLAILHRSLAPVEEPVREWGELWIGDATLDDFTDEYLERYRERFDLLHPEVPFYQVSNLRTEKDEVSSLARLVADVPNGEPYFTTRQKRGLERISFAEAARWLVHCQAFDSSGIKSGAVGDPRVKKGKGYGIGTAWAGSLGGILIEGDSLKNTLLLNLVLGDSLGMPWPSGDSGVWERPPLTEKEERGATPSPTGVADLFTWQSRRIRLVHDGSEVAGILIANGDALKPQNVRGIENLEPMSSWRRSETQEKLIGDGRKIYMPKTHDPSRSLWRGLGALLPQGDRESQRADGSRSLPPISLGWIALLQHRGVFESLRPVRTRAIGIKYGSQSATVAEIVDDSLAIHPGLLTGSRPDVSQGVVDAVGKTESAVFALMQFAGNLAIAKGGDRDGPGSRASEDAYFLLDSPFRVWLSQLDSDTDVVIAQDIWFATCRRILLACGRRAVEEAGPVAWVGRDSSQAGRHVSSSEAYGWFVRDVSKALAPSTGAGELDPDAEKEEARM